MSTQQDARTASPGFVDGLTVAAGAAELVRQTLRTLREQDAATPPRVLALAIGATEAAAAATAAGLARTTAVLDSNVARLPGPLRRRAETRAAAARTLRDTATARGDELLASGRDEAARMVSNAVDAVLPYVSDQLVPRLLEMLRPYLAQELVPSLVDEVMPYLIDDLIPKVVVGLMPTLRRDILPVVIGDLAASDELRDLIREQSQGFVREATDEVKVRTRSADDALEDRVRRALRLRLREANGADPTTAVDTEADHGAPVS